MKSKKVFVSYNHNQAKWVWTRLKPCLEAGGATVLIDRERFVAGKAIVGQMDAVQDQADLNLVVLSNNYMKSRYCRHEMSRAVARDPDFTHGTVIPVRLDDSKWPEKVTRSNPLYVDLRNEKDPAAWDLLMSACRADLRVSPSEWLRARDEIARWLKRRVSVNLVADGKVESVPLIAHLQKEWLHNLKIVDLQSAPTVSRPGLLGLILAELGIAVHLPNKPDDLVQFDRLLRPLPLVQVALAHFDYAVHRHAEYELDLFVALRDLVVCKKKLVLLVQSRRPFASLLPPNSPLSSIDVKTVELKERL